MNQARLYACLYEMSPMYEELSVKPIIVCVQLVLLSIATLFGSNSFSLLFGEDNSTVCKQLAYQLLHERILRVAVERSEGRLLRGVGHIVNHVEFLVVDCAWQDQELLCKYSRKSWRINAQLLIRLSVGL